MTALSYFRTLLQHTHSTYNTMITPTTKFSSFSPSGNIPSSSKLPVEPQLLTSAASSVITLESLSLGMFYF